MLILRYDIKCTIYFKNYILLKVLTYALDNMLPREEKRNF